ncbi:hypothetical protein PG985_008045 [Apiospora marii]|uniref:SHSP domain-containing protein n=1 Tax=Apiospora marii TaxID=335849 RepID=A0ABR1R9G7_9PEZI
MSRFGKYQQVPSNDPSSVNETKPLGTGRSTSAKSTKPIKSTKIITSKNSPTTAEEATELDKKHPVLTPRKAPAYNWAANFDALEEQAEAAGIVSLPTVDVGRVIVDGQITHTCNLPMYGPDNYIVYDGTDVVACVRDRAKSYPFIERLAKHHIGRRVNSTYRHPGELELDVTFKSLARSKGWVIYLRPKKNKA